MEITNVGSAAFWIMIAAIVVAGDWLRARREALKHETLRLIIEKTGHVDEAQLKALFQPPTPGWLHEPPNHQRRVAPCADPSLVAQPMHLQLTLRELTFAHRIRLG